LILTFILEFLRMNFRCAIHGSSSPRSKEFSRGRSLGTVGAIFGLGLPRVLFNAGFRETEDSRVSKSSSSYYTYSTIESEFKRELTALQFGRVVTFSVVIAPAVRQ